ncbi:MAG: hypothetical protein WCE27_04635 [Pseudolabrys sp.]
MRFADRNVRFGSKADMRSALGDFRIVPIADIAPAANNEAANYRIAAFLQSMRRASGHSVHLKFSIEQHLVAAQPTGTKMLNSYFSAPIAL